MIRSELHQIKKGHFLWSYCDNICFKSKNLYNYSNYIIRQEFIKNKIYLNYFDIYNLVKIHESYKNMMAQVSQQTLKILSRNWKSFFKSIKDWSINKDKYKGKPKLPKYKDKNGRNIAVFTNQNCKLKDKYIIFPKCFNNYRLKTKMQGILKEVRIIPKGNIYNIEIIYQNNSIDLNLNKNNFISIDLGINNFVTMVNNIGLKPIIINGKILKSINQYYNKKISQLKSQLKLNHNKEWSNKLQRITNKRNNKIKDYMHKTSKFIINYCIENNIGTIIIGYNKTWKQKINLRKSTNQNFVGIPFYTFIEKLNYKCENINNTLIQTEESYTSGTSFLDNESPIKENYNKKRRIKRGIFNSNTGIIINADVNAAYQISKKVVLNMFDIDRIVGVGLHPIKAKIA